MTRPAVGFLFGCALLLASPLSAQEHRAWPKRTFVTLDVPFRALNSDFSETVSFADTVRRSENVTFVADYEASRGPVFDVGAGVRLMKNLGVGVTASWLQRSDAASFNLMVPNPLVANRLLSVAGPVSGLNRRELAAHIHALYPLALGDRARVMLAGGPSVFKTTLDLVRSIEFDTLPGFTSLEFHQAIVSEMKKSALGFNVSADITWVLASHLGVGAVTRYSRAKMTLDPGAQSGVSRAIEVRSGGLEIGGGVRLLF